MTPAEHYQKALEGTVYEYVFSDNTRFKVVGKNETHFFLEVTVRKTKTETTGMGEMVITTFSKWKEDEAKVRLARCFEQGECKICEPENLKKFFDV